MKFIKPYSKFKESLVIDLNFQDVEDLLESLTIWHDALLNSISAKEIDLFDTLKLPSELKELEFDTLSDNVEFINSLSSLALKKSQVLNSDDYQTFLNKPCKFMFIYDINSNEIENNPVYLLFQVWNDSLKKWEDLKLYKVNDNAKKFYDKLTSRTIEVVDADQNYIYQTSNGNEWVLQNLDKENDTFKKVFRREELQQMLKDKNVSINII
jgi:hypothetical protein